MTVFVGAGWESFEDFPQYSQAVEEGNCDGVDLDIMLSWLSTTILRFLEWVMGDGVTPDTKQSPTVIGSSQTSQVLS